MPRLKFHKLDAHLPQGCLRERHQPKVKVACHFVKLSAERRIAWKASKRRAPKNNSC